MLFEDTTKSIVIASSHIKGIGPRVGSIGYVSPHTNLSSIKFLLLNNQFIYGIVLFATKTFFIRYGYEKERPKYETKNIIAAVPIINEINPNNKVENIVRTFINKFSKTNYTEHKWMKLKLDLFHTPEGINVCVFVPVKSYLFDLRTCSDIEFDSWLRSYMFKEHTRLNIYRMLNGTYLDKLKDKGLIEMAKRLNNYYESRIEADGLIKYALSSQIKREILIKLIRILKATYSRKTVVSYRIVINNILKNNVYRKGNKTYDSMMCELLKYMYDDKLFNWKLNALERIAPTKNSKKIASKAKKTKEVLESIANEIDKK